MNRAPTHGRLAPLNLVGIIVPGERVAANSGRVVAFRDGVALETE